MDGVGYHSVRIGGLVIEYVYTCGECYYIHSGFFIFYSYC